jgi:hypothetical protein
LPGPPGGEAAPVPGGPRGPSGPRAPCAPAGPCGPVGPCAGSRPCCLTAPSCLARRPKSSNETHHTTGSLHSRVRDERRVWIGRPCRLRHEKAPAPFDVLRACSETSRGRLRQRRARLVAPAPLGGQLPCFSVDKTFPRVKIGPRLPRSRR